MLNLDCNILSQVVGKALADAADHPRWINAIRRAFEEIDSNPWIERNPEGHGLIIGSPSGKCYTSNGVCDCTAFGFGRACWHRAAARLVRLHDEAQQHRTMAAASRAREPEAQRQIVCQQPDNLCSVDDPCPEHAEQAAAYLATQTRAPLGQRIAAARTAAYDKALAEVNELFG